MCLPEQKLFLCEIHGDIFLQDDSILKFEVKFYGRKLKKFYPKRDGFYFVFNKITLKKFAE